MHYSGQERMIVEHFAQTESDAVGSGALLNGHLHPTRSTMTSRTVLLVAALALVAGCGGSSASSDATALSADATDPPATESATTNPPESDQPTTIATTEAPTTAAAAPADETPIEVPFGKPLGAGTTYLLGDSAVGREMQFTNSIDGTFATNSGGLFFLTADVRGNKPMVAVFDLADARVFTDPLLDFNAVLMDSTIDESVQDAPTDYLAYFAALPGVEASDVTTTEYLGFPAQTMTWEINEFDGGYPCPPSRSRNCFVTIWLDYGWANTYFAGDSGTTYVLDIDGKSVVVEVQDVPGARDAADSLVIAS